MKDASIVVFSTHGVATLRRALHGIWDTIAEPRELIVVAACPEEAVATYLTRQYLRGRISAFELYESDPLPGHCGLDRAFHAAHGAYLVRLPDDIRLEPAWLEKAVRHLDGNPEIGVLSLAQAPGARRRGRPRKPREEVELLECLDTACFVTRHELFDGHERELMGQRELTGGDEAAGPGADGPERRAHAHATCPYQARLLSQGFKLGYLPGQAQRVEPLDDAVASSGVELEADLPYHDGAAGVLQKLKQTYQLGDDVLVTCMACGNNELEVLAARIDFCSRHNVAVGFIYELRCQECHELHYEEDTQFRCPQ